MFPLDLIAIIILFGLVLSHGQRLGKIERTLKSGKIVHDGLPQPQVQNQAQVQNQDQNISQPQSKQQNQISIPIKSTSGSTVSIDAEPMASSPIAEESSGRVLGGIGIAAVVIGIGFFLKYAFDNDWIGPAGRVMLGIIAGLVLLAVGQGLRKKYVSYSDFLFGGGLAVLYLSIFSANSFFHLITPFAAGVFMFFVTALGFVISIVNATPILAVISTLGGFFTPFLVGSTENNMFSLFAYLTILNLGVLGISFFKKWPQLIAIALIGTVINFGAWFGVYYKPDVLGPTLFFVFASFFIFLVSSVARAVTGKSAADNLNYFLLGANALWLACTGYIILNPQYSSVLGFAAVFVAIVFMFVAVIVNKFNPEDKALNIFLPGLAVVFLSVAVPLQFSGPWIAVAWFIESLVLYVIASFISNRGFQIMGVVVYILGLVNFFFWNFPDANSKNFTVFFNSHFVILVLAVVIAYTIAYMYRRFGSASVEVQKRGIVVFIIIANVLTVYAFSSQIIFYHNAKLAISAEEYSKQSQNVSLYNTGYSVTNQNHDLYNTYQAERMSTQNSSNTYVSIFWTLYAAILTAVGFGMRMSSPRRLGLALFIITAIKVVIDVWALGQIYRIVSFIVFGVIALAASFIYAKYKDRLKTIV